MHGGGTLNQPVASMLGVNDPFAWSTKTVSEEIVDQLCSCRGSTLSASSHTPGSTGGSTIRHLGETVFNEPGNMACAQVALAEGTEEMTMASTTVFGEPLFHNVGECESAGTPELGSDGEDVRENGRLWLRLTAQVEANMKAREEAKGAPIILHSHARTQERPRHVIHTHPRAIRRATSTSPTH